MGYLQVLTYRQILLNSVHISLGNACIFIPHYICILHDASSKGEQASRVGEQLGPVASPLTSTL